MPFRVDPARDRKLRRIFQRAPPREYRRGRRIYARGDGARRVFLVREGHIRLTLPDPRRTRERTVWVAGPDEIFGEEALLPDARRRRGAWAGEDAVLAPVDGQEIHSAIRGSRRSYAAFIRSREEDLFRAQHHLALLAAASTPARLADLILDLADRFGEPQGKGGRVLLLVRLTHQELADLAGAHRSTVTTLLNDWIYEGSLAQEDGTLMVVDRRGLSERASGLRELFPRDRR